MLSRQFIREHPDEVREAARKKRVDLPLDRLLALDARVEDLKRELQARREEGNRVSRSTANVERGAKVAGSRSYILRGAGALLEMALTQFAMDRLVARGFTPLIVPALVREFCLVGSGQFPSGREQTYELPADDVFLSGTAEVAMIGMHADEILPLDA